MPASRLTLRGVAHRPIHTLPLADSIRPRNAPEGFSNFFFQRTEPSFPDNAMTVVSELMNLRALFSPRPSMSTYSFFTGAGVCLVRTIIVPLAMHSIMNGRPSSGAF